MQALFRAAPTSNSTSSRTEGTTFGKTNVVPRKTIVQGGLRTISVEQQERAQAAMRAIVEQHLPHTEATITFDEGYPPMSPTDGNKPPAGEVLADQ